MSQRWHAAASSTATAAAIARAGPRYFSGPLLCVDPGRLLHERVDVPPERLDAHFRVQIVRHAGDDRICVAWVEDEVTAVVDLGDGATGVFITAVHDLVGTDRFEILGDNGKIVVDNSLTATVTWPKKPERELSDTPSLTEI